MLGSGIVRRGSWRGTNEPVRVGGTKSATGEWIQLALLTLQRDLAVYPDRISVHCSFGVKLRAHRKGHCVTAFRTREQPRDQCSDRSNPDGGDHGTTVKCVHGLSGAPLPNGSRLSCGRNDRWRKAVEPQTKRHAGEATQFFPQERPAASSAC